MTSEDHDGAPNDAFAYHLALGTWPPADPYLVRLELNATRDAGAASRRALEAHLHGRIGADELAELTMLVCELVNNAVIHGGESADAQIELLIGATVHCVRVEVNDGGAGFERPASPSPHEGGGGFGLLIVDRIASRWGVGARAGSCVWFEVDR